MSQTQRGSAGKSLANLQRSTDILSGMLVQEVRALNERQKAARKEQGADSGAAMKWMKEMTAMLKDLAAVAKTVNDQGTDTEGQSFGVVLLPMVEETDADG